MADMKKKMRIRAGHRGHAKKIICKKQRNDGNYRSRTNGYVKEARVVSHKRNILRYFVLNYKLIII